MNNSNIFLEILKMDMTLVFQTTLLALVLVSILLVVAVPVVFASPDGWNSNKNYIFTGAAAWAGLVFVVGSLNTLVI